MDTEDEPDTPLDAILKQDFSNLPSIWNTGIQNAKPFTRADFDTAVDLIFRDHGMFGRHPLECIYLTDEDGKTHWMCAPDCPFEIRRIQAARQAESNDHPEDPPYEDEEDSHW